MPGTWLAGGAVVIWGVFTGSTLGWTVAGAALVLLALATGLKYLIPARWMKDGGVQTSVLLVGAVVGIVGFFVIPVVGLVLGFIGGVFVAEWIRVRSWQQAWPTTVTAMKAAGLSTLIEFAAAVLITATWVGALLLQ